MAASKTRVENSACDEQVNGFQAVDRVRAREPGLPLAFVRGDSVQSELAGLPPEVRARIESAFTLPSSDKLEAAATELDAYGLHTLAERVRQFASNLQGAS
jgi:hypothetical protein